LHGHVKREEDASVRQLVAEAVEEKEEYADQLRRHGSPDELSQHHFRSSVG